MSSKELDTAKDLETDIRNIIKSSLYSDNEQEVEVKSEENKIKILSEENKDANTKSIKFELLKNSTPNKTISPYKRIENSNNSSNQKNFQKINYLNDSINNCIFKSDSKENKNYESKQNFPNKDQGRKIIFSAEENNSEISEKKDIKNITLQNRDSINSSGGSNVNQAKQNFFNFQNEKYVQKLTQIKKKMQVNKFNKEEEGTPFFPKTDEPVLDTGNTLNPNSRELIKSENKDYNKMRSNVNDNKANTYNNLSEDYHLKKDCKDKENIYLENEGHEIKLNDKNLMLQNQQRNLTSDSNSINKTESNFNSTKSNLDLKKIILEKNRSLQNKLLEKAYSNRNSHLRNLEDDLISKNKKSPYANSLSIYNSANINTHKLKQIHNAKDAGFVDYINEIQKKLDMNFSGKPKGLNAHKNKENLNYLETLRNNKTSKNYVKQSYDFNSENNYLCKNNRSFSKTNASSNFYNNNLRRNFLIENSADLNNLNGNNNYNKLSKNIQISNDMYSNRSLSQDRNIITSPNLNPIAERFDFDLSENNNFNANDKNFDNNKIKFMTSTKGNLPTNEFNQAKNLFEKPNNNLAALSKDENQNNLKEFLSKLDLKHKALESKLNQISKFKLEISNKNKIIYQYENMNIALQQEIESLNHKIEENKLKNIEWLKEYEEIRKKINQQEAEKLAIKEENENLKNQLDEKNFKMLISENKLKALEESSSKVKDLYAQYEKSLFDLKSEFRAKEDNYKNKIEDANDILISKIKEQEKEFENVNGKNIRQLKKLERELNDLRNEKKNFLEKISQLEKNLNEVNSGYEAKMSQIEKENMRIIKDKEAENAYYDRTLRNITTQANGNIMNLNEELGRMSSVNEENIGVIAFLSNEKNNLEEALNQEAEKCRSLENELNELRSKIDVFNNENNNLNNNLICGAGENNNNNNGNNNDNFSNRLINSPQNFSEIEAFNRNHNTMDKSGFYSINAWAPSISNTNRNLNSKNNFYNCNKNNQNELENFNRNPQNTSYIDYKLVDNLEKELKYFRETLLEKEDLIESLNDRIDSYIREKEKVSMQLNAKINRKELEVENFKLKIEKLKKKNRNLQEEICLVKDTNKKIIGDFKEILGQKENQISLLKFNLDKTIKNLETQITNKMEDLADDYDEYEEFS